MNIGERLKEERERLGMTIPEFAEIAGAKKNTVIDWQKGLSGPPAAKLAALAVAGIDVLYVITGERSERSLTADEWDLLALFRAAPLTVRAAAIGALQGGSAKAASRKEQVIHGKVGQVMKVKNLDQQGISFFGTDKKK